MMQARADRRSWEVTKGGKRGLKGVKTVAAARTPGERASLGSRFQRNRHGIHLRRRDGQKKFSLPQDWRARSASTRSR